VQINDGGARIRHLAKRAPESLTVPEYGEWLGLVLLGEWMEHPPADVSASQPVLYLAEQLLRVRSKDGSLLPLRANRVQREYEARRGRGNIVLKARQMGISTWVAARMFLRTILRPGTLSVQVAHNQTAAEEIFRIVKRFYSSLPAELHDSILCRSRDNRRQMVFSRLDSEYRVESAADVNAGRGLTIQNLHCSEVARWPRNAAATMAGLRAALAPDGELVIESTPQGAHGCFYDLWQEAGRGNSLVQHFFPWWWEDSYVGDAVLDGEQTEEERELAERENLTAEQIGFRRQQRAQFRGMARQEYAEDAATCFLGSGDCIFDIALLERRLQAAVEPAERSEGGRLWVWFPPRSGRKYVVGVDPAGGGVGGDFCALQVLDVDTGLQCAEWQARAPVREAAAVALRVARRFNGAVIAVERNNHGSGLLACLEFQEPGIPAVRIYEQDGQAGWPTTARSRPAMLERVGLAIEAAGGLIQSARLLAECKTMVRQRNGKAAAAAGCHDDCVMAMAVALSVREELLGPKKR
jgi:hypothetical protein